jgi:hypothetical protein
MQPQGCIISASAVQMRHRPEARMSSTNEIRKQLHVKAPQSRLWHAGGRVAPLDDAAAHVAA